MSHSYVWSSWLIHMCEVRDSFICRDTTQSVSWADSHSLHENIMSHVTLTNERFHFFFTLWIFRFSLTLILSEFFFSFSPIFFFSTFSHFLYLTLVLVVFVFVSSLTVSHRIDSTSFKMPRIGPITTLVLWSCDATHCNTLQHTATHANDHFSIGKLWCNCNLQATHYNT